MKNALELNRLLEEKINNEVVTKNETESDKDKKESLKSSFLSISGPCCLVTYLCPYIEGFDIRDIYVCAHILKKILSSYVICGHTTTKGSHKNLQIYNVYCILCNIDRMKYLQTIKLFHIDKGHQIVSGRYIS